MCFRFDAWCCFGAVHDHDDDYYGSPAKGGVVPPHHQHHAKTTAAPHHHPLPNQRNGHHYANGHRALHNHQMPAADEEDRKASNDARRGFHPSATTKGAHGYGAGAQETAYMYAGAGGNTRIADGANYHHYYQREPAHRYP